jgi:hypothetical protein
MTDFYDDPVQISPGGIRFSVETMRSLKKATGRTLSELNEDELDGMQATAFLVLHKRYAELGHLPDAGELWERAGLVEITLVEAPRLDPTSGESSTTSLTSADTGA